MMCLMLWCVVCDVMHDVFDAVVCDVMYDVLMLWCVVSHITS